MPRKYPPLYPDRAPIPDAVRHAVMVRAKGRCEHCGDPAPLELHHTTYDLMAVTNWHRDMGDLIFGHETPAVLLALCRDCHQAEHVVEGVFFANPDDAEGERDYLNQVWGKD